MTLSDRPLRTRFAIPVLLLPVLVALASAPAGAFELTRTAFSGGAVAGAGGGFGLRATLGEAGPVGLTVGTSHAIGLGFWAGYGRILATDAPAPGVAGSVASYVDGLRQNFPNPFRRSTSIVYTVGQAAPVMVAVYDVAGRRIATLTDSDHDPGLYRLNWEGRDGSGNRVASGIYFYRLDIGSWSSTRKLLKLQ